MRSFSQLNEKFVNSCNFIDSPCIGSTENEPMVYISFNSADKGLRNTVRRRAGVTGFKTVETIGYRHAALADGTDERIQQRPTRHVDRTLHDGNVRWL